MVAHVERRERIRIVSEPYRARESVTVGIVERLRAEEIAGDEWASWYALSPTRGCSSRCDCGRPISHSEDHLTRSPILKALSSIRRSGARTLLMGGQACVFYGAAEFSRAVV